MPKFAIVEFLSDKSVAVVATSWLVDEGDQTFCHCPPMAQMSHAVVKCVQVDPRWKTYECRQLYSTDDYSKARLKLRDAEETSNLESEVEASDRSELRKRSKPMRYESDEPGSDTEPSEPEDGRSQSKVKSNKVMMKSAPLPPPPPLPSQSQPSDTPPRDILKANRMSKNSVTRADSTPIPPSPSHSHTSVSDSIVQSDLPHSLPTAPVCKPPSSAPENFRTTRPVSAFDRCILTKLEEIKESVLDVKKTQTLITAKVDAVMRATGLSGTSEELPGDVKFPLNSVNELVSLDKKFEDSQLKYAVIKNISTVGGSSVKECTRRILRHVLTNSCAISLNWKGRGGKLAFVETQLHTVITKALRMNPLTSTASDDDVERAMKDWLKFAKERSGRLKERESAKRISVAAADKSRRHEFGCSSKQSNRRLRPNSQLMVVGRQVAAVAAEVRHHIVTLLAATNLLAVVTARSQTVCCLSVTLTILTAQAKTRHLDVVNC